MTAEKCEGIEELAIRQSVHVDTRMRVLYGLTYVLRERPKATQRTDLRSRPRN